MTEECPTEDHIDDVDAKFIYEARTDFISKDQFERFCNHLQAVKDHIEPQMITSDTKIIDDALDAIKKNNLKTSHLEDIENAPNLHELHFLVPLMKTLVKEPKKSTFSTKDYENRLFKLRSVSIKSDTKERYNKLININRLPDDSFAKPGVLDKLVIDSKNVILEGSYSKIGQAIHPYYEHLSKKCD